MARTTLRGRMRDWALRRQGPDQPPLTLHARRIYILPNRAGLAFGGLIAVTFVAGLNYGSGLAMLLAFWLTGFALVAMLRTHRSLAGLRLDAPHAERVFAGEAVPVQLALAPGVSTMDLRVASPDGVEIPRVAATLDGNSDQQGLLLQFPPGQRGVWTMPALQLSTQAPFGLFRTWAWLSLPLHTEIYPLPEGGRALPAVPGTASGQAIGAAGQDELTWLRPFRDGDSPRQVAWKAYAREAPLLVREYRGNAQLAREFDYDALSGLPVEQRLSQLCAWVLAAFAHGERYRLRLPGDVDLEGSGSAHRDECLVALARFDVEPGSRG
jgi:uncharacterized protein (DUF58 family)